jgi:2-oxoglutarate/2-oxoacid ferredoxin oxidoreductase subunit beta
MTVPKIENYFDEDRLPLPFCPGCGHTIILQKLNEALVDLQLDPHKVVLVTDIGCSGLSDKFFTTNTFHGLYGRSLTYASGIKLQNPKLEVIVIIGDGGCGIGGQHLLNAARRNIGIKVLVFNNFNYGMTGGEHSVTTPPGMRTATTPAGQLEQPLDICGTVAVNGASYTCRTTTFNKELKSHILETISTEGFALLDIWELCTSYFAPRNRLSRKQMEKTLEELSFPTGVIVQRSKPEFSRAVHQAAEQQKGVPLSRPVEFPVLYEHNLSKRKGLILAGDAGTKIGSAARIFCSAGLYAGLHTSQRHDYPVTVQSGFSVSEIVLSPSAIEHPGVDQPAWVIALFPAGLKKILPIIHELPPESNVYLDASLPDVKTSASVFRLDFTSAGRAAKRRENRALTAVAAFIQHEELFDLQALEDAAGLRKAFAEQNLEAVHAGKTLLQG